jgi:hypothetical protein
MPPRVVGYVSWNATDGIRISCADVTGAATTVSADFIVGYVRQRGSLLGHDDA